ncbi:MAG: hypothetical protein IPM54_33390 [Polyangiaceae bacterium]|nr:hypothetical protein [Polyangiaceae bacterium]
MAALQACTNGRVSRLSRHSYDIAFKVQVTAHGVVRDVEPNGNRLDDAELEACMIEALEQMSVLDVLPEDESLSSTNSESILPHSRSLIGDTTMLLPHVYELIPVVVGGSGVTIVVGVGVVVLAAAVAGHMSKECQKQWEDAREKCDELLSSPNPPRNLTGGYKNREDCARGHVDERCGGNKIDWGRAGRPGRRT